MRSELAGADDESEPSGLDRRSYLTLILVVATAIGVPAVVIEYIRSSRRGFGTHGYGQNGYGNTELDRDG